MSLEAKFLAELYGKHSPSKPSVISKFSVGERVYDWNQEALIMGVINLSPDSWYRESVCLSSQAAIRRGRVLLAQGADVIDVGAESSLNSADRVEAERQLNRVLPVIQELSQSESACISLETYRFPVAEAGSESGADVINLTGYQDQEAIFELAASKDLVIILCFVDGSNVREVDQIHLDTHNPIPELRRFFEAKISMAQRYGVQKLVLDPGLGFYYRNLLDGKTRVLYQMRAFLESYRLHELGFPVCNALPHAFEYFEEEVRTAEPFFATLAGLGGTQWFRTHEVAKVKPVVQLLKDFEG